MISKESNLIKDRGHSQPCLVWAKLGNLGCIRISAMCLLFLFVIIWIYLAASTVFDWNPLYNRWSAHKHKKESLLSYSVVTEAEYKASLPGLIYRIDKTRKLKVSSDPMPPHYFKLIDLLQTWPPDDTSPAYWLDSPAHPDKGNGIIRLNFLDPDDLAIAFKYRDAELPFILVNVPDIQSAAEKFSLTKIMENFGSRPREIEISNNNHFLYYKMKKKGHNLRSYPQWTPPQQDIPMTFSKFLKVAKAAEDAGPHAGQLSLVYMTISADEGARTPWISDALPLFQPRTSLFVVDPEKSNGINCRFGMRGVIAAAHYDGHLNFIAMIRGRKRYIILPPSECPNLYLYPRGHPSSRHSSVDWSDIEKLHELNPQFLFSQATEAVLSMGEMMYLPSYWFHYIISQDASIQCNSRSGVSSAGRDEIDKCGF